MAFKFNGLECINLFGFNPMVSNSWMSIMFGLVPIQMCNIGPVPIHGSMRAFHVLKKKKKPRRVLKDGTHVKSAW